MEDKWNQAEEKLRRWIRNNKALMSFSVLVGFLLTPFLWPFFLAVVYTALSLAVPVFLILLGIKMPWKAEPGKGAEKDRTENGPKDSEKKEETHEQRKDTFSQRKDSKNEAAPESEQKEKKNAAKPEDRKNSSRQGEAAMSWYVQEGKARILKLMRRADEENAVGISIHKDGICSAKGKNGYYRIGALRNFPGRHMELLASQFRKDVPSVSVRVKGKYLCIFWKKEERA